ncbi:GerAB/ArcD/ProY family transporter [Actinomycetes bacterium NPDC127524]
MKSNNQIGYVQSIFFIIQTQIGVGILSMPFQVFMKAKEDAWISVLAAGAIIQCLLFIYSALCRKFPDQNLYEICVSVLGRIPGTILGILYIIFFILVAGNILAMFGGVINKWLLPQTPVWVIILLMMLTGVYAVRSSINVLAKFFVLSSFVFLIFTILSSISFLDADFLNVFPIGHEGVKKIALGTKEATFSMIGFEMFLVIYPHIAESKISNLTVATAANLFVTLFYFLLTAATLLFFSESELKLIHEPLLYIIKSYSFTILDRIDILFLSLWVIAVGTSFMSYLFAASKGLAGLFKKKDHLSYVIPAGVITYCLSLIPDGEYDLAATAQFISVTSLYLIVLLPVILFIIALFVKRKE